MSEEFPQPVARPISRVNTITIASVAFILVFIVYLLRAGVLA